NQVVWYKGQGGLYDYGDAPASYGTTLAADGARHLAVGPRLGADRDGELDGAASAAADGDDVTLRDDEGGVALPKALQQGRQVKVPVNVQNAPAGARLDAWVDFNGDGDFADPGEQIAASLAVAPGDNTLTVAVPAAAPPGATYARFRLSTAGGLAPTGAAADGEVEDFRVPGVAPGPGDSGDAPAPYPSFLGDGGAYHSPVGPTLGAARDADDDGQPTAAADGDGADDDGVTFGTVRVGQLGATVTVTVGNAPSGARLDAWIDLNGDGARGGPVEQIAANRAVV